MALLDNNQNLEIIGEGQRTGDQLVAMEKCRKLDEDTDKQCKYIDNYGNCIFDNCIWDMNEIPNTTKKWWYKCIICDQPSSINPRYMKAHICQSCQDRMWAAEKLPFKCVHCGKTQNHPSKLMFSGICDECFKHEVFNDCYTVRHHTYMRKDQSHEVSL